jgi:hypothetical protein
MDAIKKIYRALEEKVSGSMRVILVIAVAAVLLTSLIMVIVGGINSAKKASLETDISVLEYDEAKKILFNKQIQVVEEKDEEAEEEEAIIPFRIKQIHKSIKKHFNDLDANRDQFADKNEGLSPEILQDVVNHYASGRYEIGTFSYVEGVAIPTNSIGCSEGIVFPRLNLDQYNQMLDGMVQFWQDAESGTSEDSSKFNAIKRFSSRLGTVYVANDLFLCGFANSMDQLELINNAKESEVAQKNMEGFAMIGASGVLMETMFKFFAAFAIVFLSLILIRIEKVLKN